MSLTTINLERRDMQLTRLYYFLYFGGAGFMSPFLSLFYVQQGMSGSQIGLTTAIMALVTLVAAPFWTNRNSQWRNPRVALQLFVLLTAISYFVLSQQTLFAGIALVSLLRAFVSAGILPLSDSLALTVIKATRAGYGSIRVWGSIGYVVIVPISGWLVGRTELKNSLIGAGIITIFAVLILFPIPPGNFTIVKSATQKLPGFRELIHKVLHNRGMIAVALMLIIIGFGNSGVSQFENVYLRQLGASDSLIAIAGMLSAVVEMPCMLWADRLVTRRGNYPLLLLAMLWYVGLRVIVLAAPSVQSIMLTRAMTGFGFSLYTVALVRFIVEQSTPHETRNVLALYTVTLANLVSIAAAPVAGVAYDHLGARWLYLIAASGYLLAWGGLYLLRQKRPATQTAG